MSEAEQTHDLPMYIDGTAFTWFAALPDPVQKSWELFSSAFLKQYAGGLSTNEAALQELKFIKKGTMPMLEFDTKLTTLFNRANIFALHLQLDYLRGKLPSHLGEALIMKDPQRFEEAVLICSRMEAHLLFINNGSYNPSPPTLPALDPSVYLKVSQNFQQKETRTCYKCKKLDI